jgi:hypothetical protein
MMRWAAVLLVGSAAAVQGQQAQLRAAAERNDSSALLAQVRLQPNDARDLLRALVSQAGRPRAGDSDSVLHVAARLATAYAAAWDDSFPRANLARFRQMTAEQRAAKVCADSLRVAGNGAFARKGVGTAIRIWRDALGRSRAIPDTPGVAAALGNIGSGFYHGGERDSAELYLTRARNVAELIGDRLTAGNAMGRLGLF